MICGKLTPASWDSRLTSARLHSFLATLFPDKYWKFREWYPTLRAQLPGGSAGKESTWNAGDMSLIPGSGRSLRKKWQPTPVFLPRKFHGQEEPGSYSPCGCKDLDQYPDSATSLSCDPVHNWIFLNLTFLISVMKMGLLSLSSSLDCYVDWNKKNCRKILWRIGKYDHNTLTLLRILSGVCAWPRGRETGRHTHSVCMRAHCENTSRSRLIWRT